jgi:pimeloyl-ACP methyl ester carboxylesterase
LTTYILPGMGADATMYGPAFKKLKDVQYLDWPAYNNEKSIKDISIRIINEYNIHASDIVGGSSLGGIVAAEIAKNTEVKKILLIGSTLTPQNISPILKKLSVLSEIAPINLIKTFVGKASLINKNHLLKIFGNVDSAFIKAMCKAVFEWDGNSVPHCDYSHIHGAKDFIIYPPKTGATIIDDGGHLIPISHEEEVADFIKDNTYL